MTVVARHDGRGGHGPGRLWLEAYGVHPRGGHPGRVGVRNVEHAVKPKRELPGARLVERRDITSDLMVIRLGLAPLSAVGYACGHPGMVQDVTRRLGPRGFVAKEEKYWKE